MPLEHVLRAQPPWRHGLPSTQCGRASAEFVTVLTPGQLVTKVKAQGETRAAMTTCMTCWLTAGRHGGWDTDPIDVLTRGTGHGYGVPRRGRNPLRDQLLDELTVITALIEAHREEFDQGMADLAGTVSLADERRARRRRW